MRNKFPGTCYRCGQTVEAGAGHFELVSTQPRTWRTQHAECAIAYRGMGKNHKGDRPPSVGVARAWAEARRTAQ